MLLQPHVATALQFVTSFDNFNLNLANLCIISVRISVNYASLDKINSIDKSLRWQRMPRQLSERVQAQTVQRIVGIPKLRLDVTYSVCVSVRECVSVRVCVYVIV